MHDIVEKILQGESSAIETFYDTFAPKMQRYLQYRLPEHADIEAFTNDILLEVIDSLALFEKKSSLTSWVYKIAHNKLVDYYRKKKITSLLLSKIPFLELIAEEVYEPEFQFEKNKLRDRMEVALRSLSRKYRKILRLHYEEQKSIKEIAVILQLSPKATESLLFRARQQFKKVYGEK